MGAVWGGWAVAHHQGLRCAAAASGTRAPQRRRRRSAGGVPAAVGHGPQPAAAPRCLFRPRPPPRQCRRWRALTLRPPPLPVLAAPASASDCRWSVRVHLVACAFAPSLPVLAAPTSASACRWCAACARSRACHRAHCAAACLGRARPLPAVRARSICLRLPALAACRWCARLTTTT